MKIEKPKEFWVQNRGLHFEATDYKYEPAFIDTVHVIEKSAFDLAINELKSAHSEIHSEFCGDVHHPFCIRIHDAFKKLGVKHD